MDYQYKFYATLLDSFAWYLKSDADNAEEEFINKVNRVPFTSAAADKGTAFNKLVDQLIADINAVPNAGYSELLSFFLATSPGDTMGMDGFAFERDIIQHFVDTYRWARPQLYVEAPLVTARGTVLLYGYIDELLFGSAHDIKTTSSYDFPKYLHNWQHIVYPYCLNHCGVLPDVARHFNYEVTDFKRVYSEPYIYRGELDRLRLVDICEQLIAFLDARKHLITDKKVFGLDEVPES